MLKQSLAPAIFHYERSTAGSLPPSVLISNVPRNSQPFAPVAPFPIGDCSMDVPRSDLSNNIITLAEDVSNSRGILFSRSVGK